jgi:thymidylate synthase (FAD)
MTKPTEQAGFKVYREPNVYLVSTPNLNAVEVDRFCENNGIEWKDAPENPAHAIPELGGRLCYMAFGDKQGRAGPDYLRHIMEVGHGSVIEHVNFVWIVEGVSRSFSHELVRHRAGCAYSQLSQRYVDSVDAACVVPPEIQNYEGPDKSVVLGQFFQSFSDAVDAYEDLTKRLAESFRSPDKLFRFAVDQGMFVSAKGEHPESGLFSVYLAEDMTVTATRAELIAKIETNQDFERQLMSKTATARRKAARSTARSVLPNCTETKLMVTMNARAQRHVLSMRGSPSAEIEIRRVATMMHAVLVEQAPWLFQDYEHRESDDGVGFLESPYPKV